MGSFTGLESFARYLPVVQQGVGLALNLATGEAGVADGRARDRQALEDLQRRQQAELQNSEADAAQKRAEVEAEADKAERARRAALRRSVARQRSQFGSSGISTAGGSSEAVLLGLFEESDAQRQERERLDALRFNAIDQDLENKRRLNLIQRTQLQESLRLGRLSSGVDRVGGFLDFGLGAANLFSRF